MDWVRSHCRFRGKPFSCIHFDVHDPVAGTHELRGREFARESICLSPESAIAHSDDTSERSDSMHFVVGLARRLLKLEKKIEDSLSDTDNTSDSHHNLLTEAVEEISRGSFDHAALESSLETVSGEIGAVLWRDACDFMLKFLELYRKSWQKKSVIELGAGSGYVGLAVRTDQSEDKKTSLGGDLKPKGKVVLTDLAMLVPQMRMGAAERRLNELEFEVSSAKGESNYKNRAYFLNSLFQLKREIMLLADGSTENSDTTDDHKKSASGTVSVHACDWNSPETVPDADFEYILCCEVLYAGREVWAGLRACLRKIADRPGSKFREVLLAVNLRVGRRDIDDFLKALTNDDEDLRPCNGDDSKLEPSSRVRRIWDVRKIFENRPSSVADSCGAPVITVAESDMCDIPNLRDHTEEEIRRRFRQMSKARNFSAESEGESDAEMANDSLRRKAGKKVKTNKKRACENNSKSPDTAESADSLTDFGIEIYSFRRVNAPVF